MVDQERRLLANAERLLVDGNNLVGGRDDVRLGSLEATLRRLLSPRVVIEVFRDGGARSADDQIIVALGDPDPGHADRLVVVSDDRELRSRARRIGASVVSARYFRDLLDGESGGGSKMRGGPPRRMPPQQGRPPSFGAAPASGAFDSEKGDDEEQASRWRPGRGATRKRGPATRRPRSR